MQKIPICKFPTTVLVIDDSKHFLKTLLPNLDKKYNSYDLYISPHNALDYLEKEYIPSPFINKFITEIDNEGFQHRALNINLYELPNEVYDNDRFSQVSTIIVDYDMPGIGGLELCARVKTPLIQKILLTGAADDHLAVQAFNQGLIQQFISKADENMPKKLNRAVLEAQNKYFVTSVEEINNLIMKSSPHSSALKEQSFSTLFNSLVHRYDIVEHYLFEDYGSFLMIDSNGKPYGLFIYPEQDINDMAEEAEETEGVDIRIANALKTKSKIFCYHQAHSIRLTGKGFPAIKDRLPYLRNAHELVGSTSKYYYAFTDDIMDIDKSKILSYNSFKNQHRKNLHFR